jgi:energy-coupling factor transporter ATP-binding protein EcfA2
VLLLSKTRIFSNIALVSGKNVLLVGAPGVGKTRLAKSLAGEGCLGFEIVTCREGLTYDRLVAFYSTKGDKVSLELGPLARSLLHYWLSLAVKTNRGGGWIVLDEVNRVNIDVVLGEVFTAMDMEHRMSVKVLGEDLLEKALEFLDKSVNSIAKMFNLDTEAVNKSAESLAEAFKSFGGVPLPYSYRFIATMNIYDRAQLYRLGHAFVRRFAYIYMPPPYKSYSVTWSSNAEEQLLKSDVSKNVYNMLTNANSYTVKQAVKELEMNKYEGNERVKPLVTLDRPTICIPTPANLMALAQEFVKPGGFCDKAFKFVSYVYGMAEDMNVELGFSLLVDSVKMCVVACLANYSKIITDSELADLILSSIVLPQLGVVAPRLRAEALLGSEKLVNRVREMRKAIENLLSDKSLSCRVLGGLIET